MKTIYHYEVQEHRNKINNENDNKTKQNKTRKE